MAIGLISGSQTLVSRSFYMLKIIEDFKELFLCPSCLLIFTLEIKLKIFKYLFILKVINPLHINMFMKIFPKKLMRKMTVLYISISL